MKRTLLTTVLGLLITTFGCKNTSSGEVTAANYEAKDVEMMDKAIAVFGSAGSDCDKAAAAVGKFFDDNRTAMHALKAFAQAHPDLKKQEETKHADKLKSLESSVGSLLETCKDSKAMQDALKKNPE